MCHVPGHPYEPGEQAPLDWYRTNSNGNQWEFNGILDYTKKWSDKRKFEAPRSSPEKIMTASTGPTSTLPTAARPT